MTLLTTTTQKRNAWIKWLDHCGRGGAFVNQPFFGKTVGGVADAWADAFVALEQALRAGGYTPQSAWAYNFRGIGGKPCSCSLFGECSLHSQGTTIDIDPTKNPYIVTPTFSWSDTAFTPDQIALIEGIKNTGGEQMWFWGGRWNSIKDYMHFEPYVGPDGASVDWSTVPGSENIGGFDMLAPCKKGDKGTHVLALQIMLFACGFDAGPRDGIYGDLTAAALLAARQSLPGGEATVKSGDEFTPWAYENLHRVHNMRFGGGTTVVNGLTRDQADDLYQPLGTIPSHGHNYAKPTHGHKGTVTETTEVTLT